MSAPSFPNPDDAGALSARERAVLAELERELVSSDPDLDETMTRVSHRGVEASSPISVCRLAWLVPALLVLAVMATVMPRSWWVGLALLTALVVVPWMLLCAFGRRSPD